MGVPNTVGMKESFLGGPLYTTESPVLGTVEIRGSLVFGGSPNTADIRESHFGGPLALYPDLSVQEYDPCSVRRCWGSLLWSPAVRNVKSHLTMRKYRTVACR